MTQPSWPQQSLAFVHVPPDGWQHQDWVKPPTGMHCAPGSQQSVATVHGVWSARQLSAWHVLFVPHEYWPQQSLSLMHGPPFPWQHQFSVRAPTVVHWEPGSQQSSAVLHGVSTGTQFSGWHVLFGPQVS
jgi:hypothetical protein